MAYPKYRKPGEPRKKPKQSATSYSLWLLSRKNYSEKQMHDRLVQRGYDKAEADSALAYLRESHYVDDAQYAQQRIQARAPRHGDRRVRQALSTSGISREMIDEQMGQLREENPEPERVLAVVAKFEGKRLDQALRQKVLRYLAARGFSGSALRVAMDHLKQVLDSRPPA